MSPEERWYWVEGGAAENMEDLRGWRSWESETKYTVTKARIKHRVTAILLWLMPWTGR